jgi:type II secretory pathway pseudopilin PulG
LFGWWRHLRRLSKLLKSHPFKDERGISLIEVLIGIVILGLVGITYLGGVGTSTQATIITKEHSTAESLVRSEAEYVKNAEMCPYQYGTSEYPVDPTLVIPEGWTVPSPAVEPLHGSDDGIQKVTVSAQHQGKTVLSIVIYKVAR